MSISDPTRFRKNLAGACLIAGPLLILVASVISPTAAGETADYVANIAENPGRTELSSLLFYFGFALLIPGLFGLIHLLRDRAVTLGHIGGALLFLGLVGFAALSITGFFDLTVVENLEQGEAVTVMDGIEDYTGAIVFIIVTLAGTALGLILFGLAVWRGGLAPVWVPAIIALAVVGLVVGERAAEIAANALLLGAFGFLGWRVLSMSAAEWDRPRAWG